MGFLQHHLRQWLWPMHHTHASPKFNFWGTYLLLRHRASIQLSPAESDFLKHLTPLKQLQQKCHKNTILANRIPQSLPVQRIPRVSHIPWIPHISCTSHIPWIPVSIIQWLPWVTKISNITWVSQVPWIPDIPWVSQVPWVPVVSGITHVSTPNVSSVSSISPVPAIPAIPGVSPWAPSKRGAVAPGISAISVGILLSEENTREIPLASYNMSTATPRSLTWGAKVTWILPPIPQQQKLTKSLLFLK